MKIAIAAVMFAFALGGAGTASAQSYTNYPFCAEYGLMTRSCAFNTFQQCLATVSGRNGFCRANPDYRPPARSSRRSRRIQG